MKKDELLRHIGSVDDKYVAELFEESAVIPISTARRFKGWRTIAASLALVIAGTAVMIAGLGRMKTDDAKLDNSIIQLPMAANTVVMLDVNPSIRFEVNDRNVVVDVQALNKDAEKITADIDVVGKKYETAIKVSVSKMQDKGYITNLKNSVLISVLDKDAQRAESMRKDVVQIMKKIDKEVDYGISILSQTMQSEKAYKELAETYKVSSGRIALIEKLCKYRTDLSLESIVKNNIQTINQLMVYTGIPDTVKRVGEAAGVVPKNYRDKINLDDLNGDELVKFVKAMSDFYNKLSEYYGEKDAAKQIGYVLSIAEGKNASGEKQWGIVAESRNKVIGSKGAIISVGDDSVTKWYDQKNVDSIARLVGEIIRIAS